MSDEPRQRQYPEDERLRRIQEDPDRRMTRAEWEFEESRARQAAHERHQRAEHEQQPDHGKKELKGTNKSNEEKAKTQKQSPHWGKVLLWTGVGLLVLLIIFFVGWLPRHQQAKKQKEEARKREDATPKVQVIQVKRSHTPGELTVPGTTAPLTVAYIYARANGYLKKRFVDIGDHVKKGQLLAIIDAPDLDQQVDQAREQLNQAVAQLEQQKAQLALTKVTWERWKVLVAKGVFSRQDGDQKEADYLAQKAVVASAERNVESYRANLGRVLALQSYERVTAPFNGVITERNVDIGALVGASGAASTPPMQGPQSPSGGSSNVGGSNTSGSSGSPNQSASPSTGTAQGGALFGIAQFDTLRILVSVPEGYATSVHRGMKAQVFTQEQVGKPIDGTVTRTADSIDENSRTMLTEIDLDNKDGKLYPGIYSIVSFVQVRGVAPLTVPGDAIVVRKDKTTVAIVENNYVHLVPVEIGRDYGPSVEILSGLREGDWVVSTVTDEVQPGVKVNAEQSKEAGENDSSQDRGQSSGVPDAGPNQYGDQSIVNSKSESTNQKGKPGQKQQGGQDKSGGGKQKQPKQKDSSQ